MRKHIHLLCLLAGISFLSTGCEQEMMSFEGKDCLYFNVRRGAAWIDPDLWGHQFFTAVAFGNIIGDESEVSLKIMASGSIKDYDRPFQVVIVKDSTQVTENIDFIGLQQDFVIKAGEISADVNFTALRSQAQMDDTLQLQLQIVPGEHFITNHTAFGDHPNTYEAEKNSAFAGNKDASIHNIFFYDVLTQPTGWWGADTGGGLFGKFSAKKYRLMMELTGTTIADYATKQTMPSPRATAIGQQMATYLLEKAKAHEPVLDEDGTMMFFMAVSTLGGSDAWKAFTKPEDYYK